MIFDAFKEQLPDGDRVETEEWIQSLDEVVQRAGNNRAQFLLYKLLKRARQLRLGLPPTTQTRYINTISPEQEPEFPGDEAMELRIRRLVRWNAAAMVVRANNHSAGLGGHLSTYASAASLYEVGFNHFFRGPGEGGIGDLVYFQGHAAPGIYARAFLEGRFDEADLDRFRREAARPGLSSYPHPRLMPEFWQFPTVSMGLGPINAVYQARFLRYLAARGLADTDGVRVWAFLGDGEMDEPESVAGLSLAAREGLDNLTFVVNCNLQRLDGPVRGNGKVIQELESLFRGAGWNVIKVVWGREWDKLLAKDREGLLVQRMNETLDGDFQRFQVAPGEVIRKEFFGPEKELQRLVEDLSDEDLKRLRRGGHDYRKVYAAYKAAVETPEMPTVVLAKTVKGWTLGDGVEGRNATHQIKKLSEKELRVFRDRLELPIADEQVAEAPYYHPGPQSDEVRYMKERRAELGGPLPARRVHAVPAELPPAELFDEYLGGTEDSGQEASTTMAFARMVRDLLKDKRFGQHVVPIIPDEARTFGMDPLFSRYKIYSPLGQRYTPVDADFILSYRESDTGQILEEGISEAGAMGSFTAAGTSYANLGRPMVPFFVFYSMFGFQRVGDLIWAFADARGRGFLFGATAGRTTLNGEGLQHQDGHSLLHASTVPSCRAYDPATAGELAAVIQHGLDVMLEQDEDIFYYVTLYNEPRLMPALEPEQAEGVVKGIYRFRQAPEIDGPRVRLFGSGALLSEAVRAAELLADDWGVAAEVFSVPSYGELRRDALAVERENLLHPEREPEQPQISRVLAGGEGPVVAVSDWVKSVPDLIARWVPAPYTVLGTDGFGRSDTRQALRRFFEVDAEHTALAALSALVRQEKLAPKVLAEATRTYKLDPDLPDPAQCAPCHLEPESD